MIMYKSLFQAVWFTEELGKPGPVFGSSDKWKGMGLFFDSFDNDGEVSNAWLGPRKCPRKLYSVQ